LLLLTVYVHAEDRVNVQIQFKKGIFECKGGREMVDWNVGGGNDYTHVCKDGTKLNMFREYNGTVKFTPDEYIEVDDKALAVAKQAQVDEWLYTVDNPPPYVEPSVKDYQQMIGDRLDEVARYTDDMAKIATVAEMTAISDKLEVQKVAIDEKIAEPIKVGK